MTREKILSSETKPDVHTRDQRAINFLIMSFLRMSMDQYTPIFLNKIIIYRLAGFTLRVGRVVRNSLIMLLNPVRDIGNKRRCFFVIRTS